MYEHIVGPTGPVGDEGPLGTNCCDSGALGTAGEGCPIVEKYPHGWTKDSHAGIRGPWDRACETELLDHLVYWLDQCREPILHDQAGNAYCGVDENVIKQTRGSLLRYKRLLTQPLGKRIYGF